MKFFLVASAAVMSLALGTAADAQSDHHGPGNRGSYNHGSDDHGSHGHGSYHGPPPRRFAPRNRFREGQVYRGHHMHYNNGRWGYYQPQNGASIFISIPL